jgi:hypothetical protein
VAADRGRARKRAAAAVVVAVVALAAACGGGGAGRQAAVAEHGAEVMPFDLDATTHRFTPVDGGLVQTVVVRDPSDRRQVGLVRAHLAAEADRFAAGDYGDPARIHGTGMPGLADLEDGGARIAVTYAEVPGGARITYTTGDPALVRALHRWGRAQVADHGSPASS